MTPPCKPKFCFESTLHYSSPAHGDWGIVQIGMMVPESYQLFVCPSACGRHAAIGAMQHGLKDRLSFLYVDQSDIIAGYDSLIADAVDELFRALSPWKPRVMLIFVSCLDDLIGTDHEALMSRLSEAHPGVLFRDCHMNPISLDSDSPPGVTLQKRIYSLLEADPEGRRDRAVNCVGNFEAIDPKSELHGLLGRLGCEARHISQYKRFDDFQAMARGELNLVIGPGALPAARQMEPELGIPFVFLPVSYRLEQIGRNYETLLAALGHADEAPRDFAFLGQREERAKAKIAEALAAAGDMPIVVDNSAVVKPFELARALVEYGFRVERVVTGDCPEIDREAFEWLQENAPDVRIIQPEHHNSVRFADRLEESLAIGLDGAYVTRSKYLLDMIDDGGMYGYCGVETLMGRVIDAVSREADLKAVIDSYGLVV